MEVVVTAAIGVTVIRRLKSPTLRVRMVYFLPRSCLQPGRCLLPPFKSKSGPSTARVCVSNVPAKPHLCMTGTDLELSHRLPFH